MSSPLGACSGRVESRRLWGRLQQCRGSGQAKPSAAGHPCAAPELSSGVSTVSGRSRMSWFILLFCKLLPIGMPSRNEAQDEALVDYSRPTMTQSTYSVWLVPADATFTKFSQLICRLAIENSSPIFVPHVTLIGGIRGTEAEMVTKTRWLAARLRPYAIRLDEVDYTDQFFRALFIRVEKTHEVQRAYDEARQLLAPERPEDYMPHLSLMYGDFPVHVKRQVIDRVGTRFLDEFLVDRIHLYETDPGDVSGWRKIKGFPLRGV
jgi:2'-5' RNA ligase